MGQPLLNRLILVAEDEPLIALDLADMFEEAGAKVVVVRTRADAFSVIQNPALSLAIVDHGLSDGESSAIYARLKAQRIPCVVYSGYDHVEPLDNYCVFIQKPAGLTVVMAMVEKLLDESLNPIANRQHVPSCEV